MKEAKFDTEAKCIPVHYVLTSNPPQYRCVNCSRTWFCGNPSPICYAPKNQVLAIDEGIKEISK